MGRLRKTANNIDYNKFINLKGDTLNAIYNMKTKTYSYDVKDALEDLTHDKFYQGTPISASEGINNNQSIQICDNLMNQIKRLTENDIEILERINMITNGF